MSTAEWFHNALATGFFQREKLVYRLLAYKEGVGAILGGEVSVPGSAPVFLWSGSRVIVDCVTFVDYSPVILTMSGSEFVFGRCRSSADVLRSEVIFKVGFLGGLDPEVVLRYVDC